MIDPFLRALYWYFWSYWYYWLFNQNQTFCHQFSTFFGEFQQKMGAEEILNKY